MSTDVSEKPDTSRDPKDRDSKFCDTLTATYETTGCNKSEDDNNNNNNNNNIILT
jgi:hypothetical protein